MKPLVLASAACGALFGAGLVLSGMTDPQRVLAFLDVAGAWDPTLAFVLGGAVLTTGLLFPLVMRRAAPALAAAFRLPIARTLDRRLLCGAAIFGAGWGLTGYCPGPALVGLGAGLREALWFMPAMLAGMLLHRLLARA